MPVTRFPLSWRHALQYPEDGLRHEVIDGEHFMTPAPTFEHQRTIIALLTILHEYFEKTGRGKVVVSLVDVVLTEHDLVQPDIIVLLSTGPARVVDGRVHGAPDLVVEVLSPSTRERDLGLKRLAYQRGGVPSFWIVDPRERTLTALRLMESGYEVETAAAASETFQSPTFAGLEITVSTIFGA